MLRVTVLGGAAACPNPGQGCSAYLVETDTHRLLLDCGPDTLATLQQYVPLDRLDSVLVSHLHADHTLDLVPLRYGLKYMPGLSRRSVALWMPPGGRAFLSSLGEAIAHGEDGARFFDEVFRIEEYAPGEVLTFGEVTVRFQATRHYIPCWACRVEAGGRSLVYLADTGPDPELVPFARDADVLICEGTFLHPPGTGDSGRGHLTAREAGEIAAAAGARRLVLTHLWAALDVHRLRRDAEDAYGAPVELAVPGLRIAVEP